MAEISICKVSQCTRATEVLNARKNPRLTVDSKVRGRRLPNGHIELYCSTKRAWLWDRFTGKAARRREQARLAFKQLYENERWKLAKDGHLVHEHQENALSKLLSSVGFADMDGHIVVKAWNRRAPRLKAFYTQLLTLDRLCRAVN